MVKRILRLPKVLDARSVGRSSHYNDVSAELFTKPVRIGARSVGWPEDEVAALQAARIAGKSDEEVRALVKRLHAARDEVAA